jgi:hypothetical protein
LTPNGTHIGTGINDLGGDFGLGPDSYTLVLGEFLDELLLGESPGLVVDLESVYVLSVDVSLCFAPFDRFPESQSPNDPV